MRIGLLGGVTVTGGTPAETIEGARLGGRRAHLLVAALALEPAPLGADRLAASWAERHKIPQIAFSLDTRLGARAGFRRNEQMLGLKPRYVVAFAGNGVLERLVIQAKERGIAVVDRRGPHGTNPKHHARTSGEAVAA